MDDTLVVEPEWIESKKAIPIDTITGLLMVQHPKMIIRTDNNTMMARPENHALDPRNEAIIEACA